MIQRYPLGAQQNPNASRLGESKWRVWDLALVCCVLVPLCVVTYFQQPFQRQFYLGDLSISHPFAEHERVSDVNLQLSAIILPMSIIVLISRLLTKKKHFIATCYVSLLALVGSYVLTNLITNIAKNWIARPRPDFLSRCEPKAGLPLDVLYTAAEVCTSKNQIRLSDGLRSTPSGHSSSSFAGLGFLQLWLSGQLLIMHPLSGLWRSIVSMIPLLCALYIALSRTQDYRHHFMDVFLGSCLGYTIAYLMYRRYFPALDSSRPYVPLLFEMHDQEELEPQALDSQVHTDLPLSPQEILTPNHAQKPANNSIDMV